MSVHDMLASVRKHWLLITVLTVVSTVGMGILSIMTTPMYRSSSSLYFTLTGSETATDLNQGASYTHEQMLSYASLATKPVVLDKVIDELGLTTTAADLDDSIEVTIPMDTLTLDIAVTDPNREQAAKISNSVANSLVSVVDEVAPKDKDDKSLVRAIVTKSAVPAQAAYSPNTKRNILAGFAIGLVGGIVIAYLVDVLDTRIRRTEDVENLLHVPVLAKISKRQRNDNTELLGPAWNSSTRAEEFRKFRTNLEYLDVGQDEVCIVISSALPGEGKTVTCAGLAEVLAESGKRVLVIDADLRRPRLAAYFGLTSDVGLTTVLIGRAVLEDVVQPVSENLDVLASGSIPPNPSELLASPAMRSVLGIAQSRYDVLLVDAPPLLPVADAVVLSRITAGVIIVADVKRVNGTQLREAASSVTAGGGIVRGVVLNKLKQERMSAYQYDSFSSPGSKRPGRMKEPVYDRYSQAPAPAHVAPQHPGMPQHSGMPQHPGVPQHLGAADVPPWERIDYPVDARRPN